MTDQASSGTMAEPAGGTEESGLDLLPGAPHVHEAHHGRPASWVTASIIIAGFIVGGVAMVPHPHWWLFWVGAGIVVIGGLMGAVVHIFDDWY